MKLQQLPTLPGYQAWMDAERVTIIRPDGGITEIPSTSPLTCSVAGVIGAHLGAAQKHHPKKSKATATK